LLQRRLAAQLRQVAELDDAILGKAGEQPVDVPRHEQRLDMRHERARLLDRASVLPGHRNLPKTNALTQRSQSRSKEREARRSTTEAQRHEDRQASEASALFMPL